MASAPVFVSGELCVSAGCGRNGLYVHRLSTNYACLEANESQAVDSISVDEDRAVIGFVSYVDCVRGKIGNAFIMHIDHDTGNWTQVASVLDEIRTIDLYSELDENARIGAAVSTSGRWTVVGAPGFDFDEKPEMGTVVVMCQNRVVHEIRGPCARAQFGSSVAVSRKGVIVVGAPGEASQSGAVYIFERDPHTNLWLPGRSVDVHPPPSPGDLFGYSVHASMDESDDDRLHVAIGVPGSGKAFIVDDEGCVVELRTVCQYGTNDSFGTSVSLSHGLCLVSGKNGTSLYVRTCTSSQSRVVALIENSETSESIHEWHKVVDVDFESKHVTVVGSSLSDSYAAVSLGTKDEIKTILFKVGLPPSKMKFGRVRASPGSGYSLTRIGVIHFT